MSNSFMPQLSPMSWTFLILLFLFFMKSMDFGKKLAIRVSMNSVKNVHKKWSW